MIDADAAPRERFNRRDAVFIAVCLAVIAAAALIIVRYFSAAFPEASIEFRYDRAASAAVAERLLQQQGIGFGGLKHSAEFDHDNSAKIFLERSIGLEKANQFFRRDVQIWFWRHRWFRPLQEEEFRVDVAPTGGIVAFLHKLPEDRAMAPSDPARARAVGETFLRSVGVDPGQLTLVAESERTLPKRLQRILTWESKGVRPAGAPYRYEIVLDGNSIGEFSQQLKVPDAFKRSYAQLRSKNNLAGQIDGVLLIATMLAALVVFVVRMRRGDLQLRFLGGIAIASIVLVTGVALNSFPSALAGYSTTDSYPAFIGQQVVFAILQGIGVAMLLVVIVGAGEALFRERLPQQLAIGRVWKWQAMTSKRVFLSFVLGYTMVAFFLAYQVVFYLVADRFGAWAPAEIPYDEILNSAIPWVAVLFAGFLPSLSEEFLSRGFSIPLFERVLRSRIAAFVVAGFIWGFGHATYPNQPFYIRGVEVGLAGVMLGFVMFRFGLLPLLIWHYTVDALYTALLLFRSHNTYYIVSAAAASLIFAGPMLIALALYLRNRGFVPDGELSNAAVPIAPVVTAPREQETTAPLPAAAARPRGAGIALIASIVVVIGIAASQPPSPDDAIDYRITKTSAASLAVAHLRSIGMTPLPQRRVVIPAEGFRSWDRASSREEGGSPGGFDSAAAGYLIRHGLSYRNLIDIFQNRVQAATWMARFFTPDQKREIFVEVDPRSSRVIGFHQYQEEKLPGARLDQARAQRVASASFPAYGLNAGAFVLKEALAFQQTGRRDWLFHFEERRPIAGEGFRRVSVRVDGDRVTQFAATVRIPEADYRRAEQRTLVNTMLSLLRIVGIIAIASMVIAGFVIGARSRIARRHALRWTPLLLLIPIAVTAANPDRILAAYDTRVAWQTFLASTTVSLVTTVLGQALLIFLSIAAIETAFPFAPQLFRRPGLRRFGRGAVLAGLTSVAISTAVSLLLQALPPIWPSASMVDAPSISGAVAIALPGVVAFFQAILRALYGCAILAMLYVAIRGSERLSRWWPLLATLALACVHLDPAATPDQFGLMLISAIASAAVPVAVIYFFLRDNLLAFFVAIFADGVLGSAVQMLQNDRHDLIVNGVGLLVAGLIVLAFIAREQEIEQGAGPPGSEQRTADSEQGSLLGSGQRAANSGQESLSS